MDTRQTAFLALFLFLLMLLIVVVIYVLPFSSCTKERCCCRGKKTRKSRVRFEEKDHGETILLNVIKTPQPMETTFPVPQELPFVEVVRRESTDYLHPVHIPPKARCDIVKPVKSSSIEENQSLSDRDSLPYIDMNRRPGTYPRFCGGVNGYITVVDPPTPPHLLLESPRNSCGPSHPSSSAVGVAHKTVKVGRCLPFRRSEAADDPNRARSTTLGALPNSSFKSYAKIPLGPKVRRPWRSSTSMLNLPRSCEDLFKGAWWRSTDSLDHDHLLTDDLKQKRRKTPEIRCSDCSAVYVEMRLCKTSPDSCPASSPWGRSGGGGIRRSSTMPDIFVGRECSHKGNNSAYLTVWCPSDISKNVHFSAEICPPPKPCSTPEYVNIKSSPSMELL